VLLGAVAVAAVVGGVIALTGGGGKSPSSAGHSSSSSATLSNTSHRTASSGLIAVQPSTVTVSVLNGTDMQGLAGRVAQRLTGVGYRQGSKPADASDQTQATTIVAYMAPADRPGALAVANTLKLGKASVQPIDANTKAIVCPPSQACTSTVVVTVGKDLATQ
jgi:hypothetical protein